MDDMVGAYLWRRRRWLGFVGRRKVTFSVCRGGGHSFVSFSAVIKVLRPDDDLVPHYRYSEAHFAIFSGISRTAVMVRQADRT